MNKLSVAIVALAFVGAVAYFGIKDASKARDSKPSITDESKAEREESVRAAFAPSADSSDAKAVNDDPVLEAELQEFFEKLGTAFNSGDRTRIFELFSPEALLAYGEKSGMVDLSGLNPLRRAKFRKNFLAGMREGFSGNAKANGFSNPRILRIEKIREGEVIAYVRAHGDFLDVGTKLRWWLLKNSDGQWQAYDYEDLEQSLRVSALMGALLSADGAAAPWTMEFVGLVQGLQKLAGDDTETAFEEIASSSTKILAHKLPRDIEGFALTMRSAASLSAGETAEALADLDKAEKLMPGAPGLHYQRGECLRLDGDYEAALESFQKYVDVLGWDEDVHESISDCQFQLGNIGKSLEHAEKGLAENPRSYGCLASFAVTAPEDRWDEIKEKAKLTDDAELAYATIIDFAIEVETEEVRDHVLALLKADFPESDSLEYYAEVLGEEEPDPQPDTE